MKFSLDIKPLSINAAFQGRRFNTPAKNQYERTLAILLPKVAVPGPFYRVDYQFYLKNFATTDQQNLLKCLTDCMVNKGIIRDDRFIIDERIRKFKSEHDRIDVEVEGLTGPQIRQIRDDGGIP